MKDTAFGIEKEYKLFLCQLKHLNVTAETIQADTVMYNNVANLTVNFLSNVALRSSRNRNIINSTGFDFDVFVDDITMHILSKMDSILACHEDYVIPSIITIINNEAITLSRKWKRMHPSLKPGGRKPRAKTYCHNDQDSEASLGLVFNYLDDVAWGMIAADACVEDDIINREMTVENQRMVLEALKYSSACSRFEMVSLLTTKVITNHDNKCTKTRVLAEAIDRDGLMPVSKTCFEKASALFNIRYSMYFEKFTHDNVPHYTSIEELCDKISKASNHCAVKLRRKMGINRANK